MYQGGVYQSGVRCTKVCHHKEEEEEKKKKKRRRRKKSHVSNDTS
jgi:hypothetical protein